MAAARPMRIRRVREAAAAARAGGIHREAVVDEVVLGEPDLVEAQLLRPLDLLELAADDVVVAVARRGLEEVEGAEAHAMTSSGHPKIARLHRPRWRAARTASPEWTICPRLRMCARSATESASGRFCSTSRIDSPSRLSSLDHPADLAHEQGRQPLGRLVHQEQRPGCSSAPGRSPASAARRPRACWRGCSARSRRRGKELVHALEVHGPRPLRATSRFSRTLSEGRRGGPAAPAPCPRSTIR